MKFSPQIVRLANGLRVLYVENRHSAASEFTLSFDVGTRDEKRSENGIAHFLEHMLYRGCESFPNSLALAEALESYGGETNATTSLESTSYWLRGASDFQSDSLKTFASFILSPTFPDLEVEREIILQELASDFNEAGFNIDLEYHAMRGLFPNHGLGRSIIGTKANCQAFNIKSLNDFRNKHYLPSLAILSIVTPKELDETIIAIENAFGPQVWPPVCKSQRVRTPVSGLMSNQVKVVCIPNSDNQFNIKFCFGFEKQPPKTHVSMICLQRYLDDGISSLLQSTLREKQGLVYDISADYVPYSDFGTFSIDSTISAGNLTKFIDSLSIEFKSLRDSKLINSKLNLIKFRYEFDLKTSLEHPTRVLSREHFNLTCHPSLSFDEEVEILRSIEVYDILSCWEMLTQRSNLSVVLVGPKSRAYRLKVLDSIRTWKADYADEQSSKRASG